MPLEDAFRQNLTDRQREFWCRELRDWSDNDLLQTVEFVKRDCRFFPSLADFHRLRPREPEPDYSGPPATLATTPAPPGSWGEFVIRTDREYTRKGDIIGMYRVQIAEAERRGMPADEFNYGQNVGINGLRQALAEAKERKAKRDAQGSPTENLRKRGKRIIDTMLGVTEGGAA